MRMMLGFWVCACAAPKTVARAAAAAAPPRAAWILLRVIEHLRYEGPFDEAREAFSFMIFARRGACASAKALGSNVRCAHLPRTAATGTCQSHPRAEGP